MKRFLFLCLSIVICLVSCSKDDSIIEEEQQDEYYVQYHNPSNQYHHTSFEYKDVDHSTKTAEKEIAIGPVRKGFTAT